ncbi:MAG: pentapeptide repeat-containing protein [Actinomycetes bacterium]
MSETLGGSSSISVQKKRKLRAGGAFVALALMAGLLGACELAPAPGTSNSPSGYVDVVTGGADSVRVQGWTSDWNTLNPIDVVVMINGVWAPGVFTANLPRTDVAARYGRGANFGYDVTLPAPAGALSVCVVALNVGRGENTILGCATTTATTPTTPTTTTTTSLVPVVLLPVIDSLSPVYGPIAGGTTVTLIGSGFTGASSVTFQGVEATSVTVVSATEVTAVSPALAAGPADIFVTTPGGTSGAPGIIDYTYIDCADRGPGADLRGCDLSRANLSGLDLTGANLTDAFLLYANLSNTVLQRANLTNTVIDTSTLRGTALEGAILDGTDFVDNDMTGSHLDNARFTGGRLRGVNLTDATLPGTDLTGVDLTGAIWSNTTCPNGTVQSTECPRTP